MAAKYPREIARRTRNGRVTLKAYIEARKLDRIEARQQYTVADCIADLLHYAASKGFDTDLILSSAQNHFDVERQFTRVCTKCNMAMTQAYLDENVTVESGRRIYCSMKCAGIEE
jgi:hypothetical protein